MLPVGRAGGRLERSRRDAIHARARDPPASRSPPRARAPAAARTSAPSASRRAARGDACARADAARRRPGPGGRGASRSDSGGPARWCRCPPAGKPTPSRSGRPRSQEAEIEADIVPDDGPLTDERRAACGKTTSAAWRAADHRLADAGKLGDELRDAAPGIDQSRNCAPISRRARSPRATSMMRCRPGASPVVSTSTRRTRHPAAAAGRGPTRPAATTLIFVGHKERRRSHDAGQHPRPGRKRAIRQLPQTEDDARQLANLHWLPALGKLVVCLAQQRRRASSVSFAEASDTSSTTSALALSACV